MQTASCTARAPNGGGRAGSGSRSWRPREGARSASESKEHVGRGRDGPPEQGTRHEAQQQRAPGEGDGTRVTVPDLFKGGGDLIRTRA